MVFKKIIFKIIEVNNFVIYENFVDLRMNRN